MSVYLKVKTLKAHFHIFIFIFSFMKYTVNPFTFSKSQGGYSHELFGKDHSYFTYESLLRIINLCFKRYKLNFNFVFFLTFT